MFFLPSEVTLILLTHIFHVRCQRGLRAIRRVCKLFNYLSHDRKSFKTEKEEEECSNPWYDFGIPRYYCCERNVRKHFEGSTQYYLEVNTGATMRELGLPFSEIKACTFPERSIFSFQDPDTPILEVPIKPSHFSMDSLVDLYKELEKHLYHSRENRLRIVAKHITKMHAFRYCFTHIIGKMYAPGKQYKVEIK
jgi:hypothetical protein